MTAVDRFIGVLPFFHSFGFTGTLLVPAAPGRRRGLPPESDGREDGRRARRDLQGDDAHQHADVLQDVRAPMHEGAVRPSSSYAIVGAEKLREPLATEFKEKFGIGLLEGYGMHGNGAGRRRQSSEHRASNTRARSARNLARSAIRFRAWPPRSSTARPGEALPVGEEGLLLVKGPT